MIKSLFDPPKLVKNIFKDFIWNSQCQRVLMTFDDGPNINSSEIILNILNDNKIKAIFFCVGNNLKNFASLTKEILSEGHQIGNHTFNHRIITKIPLGEAIDEIQKTNLLMQNDFNYIIKYFRPPHGRFNFASRQLFEITGMKNVMWSLMSFDYKNDLKIVNFALKKNLKNDSIIVFHDSNKSKMIIKNSIEIAVNLTYEKGFSFGDANQCLK